jgi:hypothetical protein
VANFVPVANVTGDINVAGTAGMVVPGATLVGIGGGGGACCRPHPVATAREIAAMPVPSQRRPVARIVNTSGSFLDHF